MKKMMMIAAMMVAALTASAQNEVGQFTLKPAVGLNLANVTKSEGKIKAALAAGVEAEYGVAESFGVTAGLFYSMQGATSKDDSDLKLNTSYLNIPILANYYILPGLAIKAGIQPGFLLSAKEKYSHKEGGVNVDVEDDIKSICNKVDLSIPVGISYEYKSFVLDARYNWGLTNFYKNDSRDKKSKNSVFMISLGYKFSL